MNDRAMLPIRGANWGENCSPPSSSHSQIPEPPRDSCLHNNRYKRQTTEVEVVAIHRVLLSQLLALSLHRASQICRASSSADPWGLFLWVLFILNRLCFLGSKTVKIAQDIVSKCRRLRYLSLRTLFLEANKFDSKKS